MTIPTNDVITRASLRDYLIQELRCRMQQLGYRLLIDGESPPHTASEDIRLIHKIFRDFELGDVHDLPE